MPSKWLDREAHSSCPALPTEHSSLVSYSSSSPSQAPLLCLHMHLGTQVFEFRSYWLNLRVTRETSATMSSFLPNSPTLIDMISVTLFTCLLGKAETRFPLLLLFLPMTWEIMGICWNIQQKRPRHFVYGQAHHHKTTEDTSPKGKTTHSHSSESAPPLLYRSPQIVCFFTIAASSLALPPPFRNKIKTSWLYQAMHLDVISTKNSSQTPSTFKGAYWCQATSTAGISRQ